MLYNKDIFGTLVRESVDTMATVAVDPEETIDNGIEDLDFDSMECSLGANGINGRGNSSDKAVQVFLRGPGQDIQIFMESDGGEWSSQIGGNPDRKISPDQMQRFFRTNLFQSLKEKLLREWNDDNLRGFLLERKYKIDFPEIYRKEREDEDFGMLDEWEVTKRKVKLGKPNETDANGNKIRSSSGRKLVSFTDMGVARGEESYYSWPGGTDEKHIFKWSRWNNWENQKPFIRARFSYNVAGGAVGADVIGISLTLQPEDNKERGFISYDLSLIPSLQYLTPEETERILKLSIMRRFLKECLRRINPIMAIPDEEIYKKINKPEKCTLDDIRKTKSVIKNTLKAVRDPRANTFIYT